MKNTHTEDGYVLVSQKDILYLTMAINAVDLATHTESKTNEVRELWRDVALKLTNLGGGEVSDRTRGYRKQTRGCDSLYPVY